MEKFICKVCSILVIEEAFGVSPTFDELDDEVVDRIYARADALAEIYF